MLPRLLAISLLCLTAFNVFAADTVQDFAASFLEVPADVPRLLSSTGGLGTPPTIVESWDDNGNAIQITHAGLGGQNNWVAWDEFVEGGYSSLDVNFQFRIPGLGPKGQGLGFGLLNTAQYGQRHVAGLAWQPDEPNLDDSLGIAFDFFNDNGIDPLEGTSLTDSVSLHYDGQIIEQIAIDDLVDDQGEFLLPDWLDFGEPIGAQLKLTPNANGGTVTLELENLFSGLKVTPFEDVELPGFTPYEARFAFGGRTIGVDASMDVDNFGYVRDGNEVLVDDFDSFGLAEEIPAIQPTEAMAIGGTPFTLKQTEGDPGPVLVTSESGPGEHDGRLQVTQEVPGLRNYILFDKTSDDTSRIEANFDFRIKNVTTLSADGMGFVIGDTDLYGDEGFFVDGEEARPWFEAEEPRLLQGLGIGFDTFDNEEEGNVDPTGCGGIGSCDDVRANHISLHWNTENVGEFVWLDRDEFDLVGDEFHNANVLVEQTDDGMVVTVNVTDGTDGSEHTIFDQVLIEGAKFEQAARVAFGARTGDAFDIHEIDNVLVRFGEPTCNPDSGGDADGNGRVEVADFLTLSANFGQDVADHTSGDFDCNGRVEISDFLVLSRNFGQAVGADVSSVPEPTASDMVLPCLLSLLVLRNRKHSGPYGNE